MKLVIESDMVFRQTTSRFDNWDDEDWDCIDDILKEYSVYFTREKENGFTVITVIAQKVTLDEFQMNRLFFLVFDLLFDLSTLRYAGFGGSGCDFSMKIG